MNNQLSSVVPEEKCWFQLLNECNKLYENLFPHFTHHNRLLRFILCKTIDAKSLWYEHTYVHDAYLMLSRDLKAFNSLQSLFIDDEEVYNHFNSMIFQLFQDQFNNENVCKWIGSTIQQLIDYSIFGYTINYKMLGFDHQDQTYLEAFASYQNHYFNHYCSIELDSYSLQHIKQENKVFNHFGNFFKLHLDDILCSMFDIIIIHPPYDTIICNAVFEYIIKLYQQHSHMTFLLFIPKFNDWKELKTFAAKCFNQKILIKHTVPLIPNSIFVGNTLPIDLMYLCYGKIRAVSINLPSK
jgi:hypothetical protein